MSEIIAKTKGGVEVVVETHVSNVAKALEYWSGQMQNVTYYARKVRFIYKTN